MPPPLLEACVDSLETALHAAADGANRLELCAHLQVGGTTPPLALLAQLLEQCACPAYPIIRPRGGEFVFTPAEVDRMLRDVAHCRALGMPGAVIGALTAEGIVDRDTTARLRDAAGTMDLTFHMAFDAVRDQAEGLEMLRELGIPRVLTRGGAVTAWEGRDRLAALVHQATGRITVMAGGGITAAHAADLVAATGVRELHLRATDAARFRAVAAALA